MIGSPRWRKLLIDLSAANKDSMFFMYCLTTISNLGHHREIANRINQSDYFGVFHSMLQSELAIAGTAAVDGCGDGDALGVGGGEMGSFAVDLRRTCTSTSYPYLYAMEVLHDLIERAESGGDSAAASAATGSQTVGSPSKAAGPGDRGRLFGEGADRARDAAEGVIGRLVKERFEKKDGDSIMGLSKKQVRSLLP